MSILGTCFCLSYFTAFTLYSVFTFTSGESKSRYDLVPKMFFGRPSPMQSKTSVMIHPYSDRADKFNDLIRFIPLVCCSLGYLVGYCLLITLNVLLMSFLFVQNMRSVFLKVFYNPGMRYCLYNKDLIIRTLRKYPTASPKIQNYTFVYSMVLS